MTEYNVNDLGFNNLWSKKPADSPHICILTPFGAGIDKTCACATDYCNDQVWDDIQTNPVGKVSVALCGISGRTGCCGLLTVIAGSGSYRTQRLR